MTSEEARQAYLDLAEVLRQSGLDWVVHQVEDSVRAGRPVEKEARVFRDEEEEQQRDLRGIDTVARRRSGKATLMMALESWPNSEQLLFVIDALRHAVVHASALERDQLALLRSFAPIQRVVFVREGDSSEPESMRFSGEINGEVARLAELLDSLEHEARR